MYRKKKMKKKSFPFFYGKEKQPFGKAVVAGGFVFLSGVSGREFETGKVIARNVNLQTEVAWKKIKSILDEVGTFLDHIVKIVIYLRNARDFEDYYATTCTFLERHCPELLENPPAMTLVESGLYQENMLVEIDITAVMPE